MHRLIQHCCPSPSPLFPPPPFKDKVGTYEYDVHYDAIAEERTQKEDEKRAAKLKNRGQSRYINDLVKAREIRDRDNEIATERMIRKRNDEEGKEFGNTEKFVTEGYKKKLEERRKWEEERRREEGKESGVESRGMGGFWKNLDRMGGEREATDKGKGSAGEGGSRSGAVGNGRGKGGSSTGEEGKRRQESEMGSDAKNREEAKGGEGRDDEIEISEEERRAARRLHRESKVRDAVNRRSSRRGQGVEVGVFLHVLRD